MKRLNRRTKTLLLCLSMGLLLLLVYFSGLFIPESAYASDFTATRLPPSLRHPFGTDTLGRDLFWRTVKGLSVSLTIGIVASCISAVAAS